MQLVFGLDIGTRSVVGSVGYLNDNKFHVVAHYVKEHDTRAMLDGQIHDIGKVGETVSLVKNQLEAQIGAPLKEVCIAAAGRVLKTALAHVEYEFEENKVITAEDIYTLDLLGIEKAHEEIREKENNSTFLSVGYSVVKYYLNDYTIGNLEGHKGRKIAADVLATFLPDEVIDGLYAAVEMADLHVANLTLEPIAAINIAIPDRFRLLNIALVDVGAGTSDISITKDGSIIAYGMIPSAGDEITESLAGKYLVEFNVAEKMKIDAGKDDKVTYKDILDIEHTVDSKDIMLTYSETVNRITKEIADKIIELNSDKSVSAVFIVGGGGKADGFIKKLAEHLCLQEDRVALRGEEVLGNVIFTQNDVVKNPLLVTPIGICLNWYDQKNSFIFVNINDIRIKLYNNNKLTVADAAVQIGLQNDDLFPKSGKELKFTVNGLQRFIRGEVGEPALITINNVPAHINSPINKNDKIVIEKSIAGLPGKALLSNLNEYKERIGLIVNGNSFYCPKFAMVNKRIENGNYEIHEDDDIKFLSYYTLEQLLEYMDIDSQSKEILVNNEPASQNTKVYEDFVIIIQDAKESYVEVKKEEKRQVVNESIIVSVNKAAITLNGKPGYSFVDVFDYINFDLSKPGGRVLKTTINEKDCGYMDPLNDGDIIEIRWMD